MSIARLATGGVKRRIGAFRKGAVSPEPIWMNLWFVFALMTAAAVFAVLWPLGRRSQLQTGGTEAAVYRDLAGGLIGASEAEAARVEISRRLLAASDDQRDVPAQPDTRLRRVAAVIA